MSDYSKDELITLIQENPQEFNEWIKDKEEVEKQIIPNNLESIKTAMSKLVNEIKEAGFNVNFEDYDFSDLYQIIIKINK